MFSSSFSGGWDAYSKRESVVSANNKARQKSKKISDATAGKKKKRKPENKGKHRKQEAVIKGSGDVKQTAPLVKGGSASQNVLVFPAKAKNRAGAGRPPKTFKSYGNSSLDSAFKDRYAEKEQKEREVDAVRQRREAREDRVRQEDIDERRRERGERQRQFNIQQQAEARREQQRQQDRAQEIAREQAREVARERREDAREVVRQQERAEELRIREIEARGRLEIEERIARQQLRPLIEQGAITLSNIGNPTLSNIGNPQIDYNPVINVGGGDDPATRRRRRGIGGGGGGRRSYDSSSDSSGGDSGGGGSSQLPTPSPRTRREQQRSSATSRRGGRTPRQSPTQQPTTPEEEASLLGGVASGLASGLATGVQTLGGGVARAGGGFIGGIGGAIAEQLPSAETIGDVAGRGAVALVGATGRGAVSLVSEAIRPAQQEVEADPRLLQSVSEVSEGESVVIEEEQQPVSTLAQRLAERQAQQQRELQQEQQEEERKRRLREQRRREKLKIAEQGEQAGILADIQSGAGKVAGVVSGAVSLVADALRRDTPPEQRPSTTTQLGEEELTSGGEEAPQILIKTDEPLASFRETYVGTGDISESDDERRRRAEREQIEREEYERQTTKTPTPAQVKADVESGTEGLFRQLDRIAKTRGDVLEEPVEIPLSPKTIQQQEDEATARRLEAKLKKPAPEPERDESDLDVAISRTRSKTNRPVVVLERGKPFTKPSNQKQTKSEDVIKTEYKKLGVDVAFVSRRSGEAVNIKEVQDELEGKGYTIYQKHSTPPKDKPLKKPPPKTAESESEVSTDTEAKFRDVRKLSPKQLLKTAEQLQRQQKDVDERLSNVGKIIEQKDKQIVNLSQRALLLDTEQSGGGESDFSSGGESRSSAESSAGEYDLRRYGRRDESEGSGSGGSGGGLLEGDDY